MHEVISDTSMFDLYGGEEGDPTPSQRGQKQSNQRQFGHLQFMQMRIEILQVYQPYNYTDTDDAFDAEKVPSARKSKQKRNNRRKSRRMSISPVNLNSPTPFTTPANRAVTPDSTFQTTTPRLIDTNVPGLQYRSPSINPTNLHLAQYAQYQANLEGTIMEV